MTFDATVSLGNVIQIVAFIIGALVAWSALKTHVRVLDTKLESEREQRITLAKRVDKLETQIDDELEKISTKIEDGLRRIYEKLDRKADKA